MDTIRATGMGHPVSHEAMASAEPVLLDRIRGGDRLAADALVEATYRPLYASLVRLCGGDRDRAADLTQETYRRAWQAFSTFDGRSQALTWLYRIGYNAFLNQLRRPMRAVPLDEEASAAISLPDPSPGAEETLSRQEAFRHLREAVLELSDEQRFAVTARYWAGLPVREIAREQGVTTVAVRKRLRRALAALQESMERSSS
jgi:RNA polymerase sigma-70 factor (ECF subfamily)